MHPIWKGAISFGLVNIPISLFSGINREENIHFHLLRKSDKSRVRNKRVAEADDHEVKWNDIVKGYEYEKDKYIILDEEELDELALKSTRVIDIAGFVDLSDIDPVYFSTPYLIRAEKGGEKSYNLLTQILDETKTAAVAKVVLRNGREHLVAVMARDNRLVADVLYFADELKPADTVPAPHVKTTERERDIAKRLVESMKTDWKPAQYSDDYEKALKDLISKKLSGKRVTHVKKKKTATPSNVIDLVAILQQSLNQKDGGKAKTASRSKAAPKKAPRTHHRTTHEAKKRRAA